MKTLTFKGSIVKKLVTGEDLRLIDVASLQSVEESMFQVVMLLSQMSKLLAAH